MNTQEFQACICKLPKVINSSGYKHQFLDSQPFFLTSTRGILYPSVPQAWAVQIVQHYTLENKQELNALRYSRTVILYLVLEEKEIISDWSILILAEIRGRCDEICWILYESTFHIFGRMKPHLSDVHSLETLLNEPRFHSDYGVCIT